MSRFAAALAVLALLLAGCASAPSADGPVQVAITVDDLPAHGALPPGMTQVQVADALLAAFRQGGVPQAYGFVNGVRTEEQPETTAVLDHWRAAGQPLANHTWTHGGLDTLGPLAFLADVDRAEPQLDRLAGGRAPRWLRHPYLHEGRDPATRAAVRAGLAARGYRIAAVTLDFGDWQWTAPYARCAAQGDTAALRRLEAAYLDAARQDLAARRAEIRALHGRDVPLVLLLHMGAIDAKLMPRLLADYRRAGVRFVTLEQAQADPVYAADVEPRLPPAPGVEAQLGARGLAIGKRASYGPMLAAACK